MTQLTEAQEQLRARAAALAAEVIAPRAAEVDRSEQYPWDNVTALREAGFMGMTLPGQYGGQGLGYLDAVLVIEEIAKVCGVTARIVVEANMGAVGMVMAYGGDAQKRLVAEAVLAGDKPAICITEPGAGSAATEMTTRAERRGDTYVINGKKHWITGGGVSRLHLIFARIIDGDEDRGIAAFLAVRGEAEGLMVGKREPAMGLRGIPETEIILEDLFVTDAMALIPGGDPARAFGKLMTAYNSQRVGAAAVALGIAEGAYETTLDFVVEREQFGRPIAEFQGLQWMLADMGTGIEAARLMILKAAAGAEAEGGSGFPDITDAARAKILASETAIRVTNDALQVFGAAGYSRNFPLERMVRDARMFTIGGGTAQILRTVVASQVLGRKLPQTRDGYVKMAEKGAKKANNKKRKKKA
ncbi:MAG: acyl-CoA dehydrogenase family protein [Proteobacteria bacterium]|nr:acyl-CoA dehydrogenase family protein [Pseudomonadota bacterium]